MENLGNLTNGCVDSRNGDHRKNRIRHKRPKFSSVSARLDPEFDAKESAHQNSLVQITNANETIPTNEELDPRTISFEELIRLLHPNFITDYLQKVLHYLKSDNKEICFPHIAPYKESFLVKIAEDKTNLKCININDISRVISKQIIEIVEAKKDVFTWTFRFESGRTVKNVLVYEKIYHKDSHNDTTSVLKVPRTPTLEISSLMSSLEDLTIDRARQELPISFKTQMLNITLKFIKDSTRFSLQYPQMPVAHAEFVYSLLHASNRREENVGFGFKSLHAPVVEAMKKFEAEFEFKVSFVDTYSDELTQVLLQKVPKTPVNAENLSRKRLWSNTDLNTSTESVEQSPRRSRATQDSMSKQRAVEGVSEDFRLEALQKLADFLGNREAVTLQLSEISQPQSTFIECIPTLARRKDYYFMLSEQCQLLLRKIARLYQTADWTLQRDVGKFDRRRLRTITLQKVPNFKNSSNKNSNPTKKDVITNGTSSNNSSHCSPSPVSMRRPLSQERSVTIRKANTTDGTNYNDSSRCSPSPAVMRRPVSQERSQPVKAVKSLTNSPPPKSMQITFNTTSEEKRLVNGNERNTRSAKSIAFHSAGAQVLDTSKTTDNTDNLSNTEIPNNKTDSPDNKTDTLNNKTEKPNNKLPTMSRRSKLIQAMSTPMESDKAERMMRIMGWEGGALGLRGEGITEPIMPALHIAPGAGLGHIKEIQQTQREFRQVLLSSVVSFLRSGERERTIEMDSPLCSKKRRFVKVALDAFNVRNVLGLGLSIRVEKELSEQILGELERHPDWFIGHKAQVKSNKIKLTLEHGEPIIIKSSKKKKKREQPSQNVTSHAEAKMAVDLTNDEDGTVSRKSENALAFRILFLKQIKQFLEFESTEIDYKFDCILNKKQKAFIESVITNTNNRKNIVKYSSNTENILFEDIRRIAKDCYLTVKFGLQKYTLQKRFYQKRFTNSALDLPPPKSKDISNTTIYINGKEVEFDFYANKGIVDPYNLLNDDRIRQDVNHNHQDVNHVATCHIDLVKSVKNVNDASTNDTERINVNVDDDMTRDSNDDDVILIKEDITTIEISDDESVAAIDELKSDSETNSNDLQVKVTDSNDAGFDFLNAVYTFACNAGLSVSGEVSKDANESKIKTEVDANLNNSSIGIDNNDSIDIDCDGTNSKDLSIDISNESLLLEMDSENSNAKTTDSDIYKEVKDLKELVEENEALLRTINEYKKEDLETNLYRDPSHVKELEINNNLYNNKVEYGACVNETNSDRDLKYLSGKRLWCDSDKSEICSKKCKKDDNIVLSITPSVLGENISIETMQQLHDLISNEIDKSEFLPLLKCHGIKNDSVVYTCYGEKSSNWLKRLIPILRLKFTEVNLESNVKYRLKMRMFTLDSVKKILNRLKLYNKDLNTQEWVVKDVQTNRDFILVTVVVDYESYDYIRKAGFSLFAGVDKAEFTVVWD